jgi:hypothetical protein
MLMCAIWCDVSNGSASGRKMAYYNLVNHDLKLIVSFNPKCACTTLKQWFVHSLPDHESHDPNKLGRFMLPASDFDRHSDYAKILFIRDPFRRLVSFYCHRVVRDTRQWCFADENKECRLEGKTFSEFMNIIEKVDSVGLTLQHHLQSQTSGSMKVIYDAVISIENLSDELDRLNNIYSINFSIPHSNSNSYDVLLMHHAYDRSPEMLLEGGIPSFKYFYNSDLRRIATKIYREDLLYYQAYHYDHLLFKAPIPLIMKLKSQFELARAWRSSGARKQ